MSPLTARTASCSAAHPWPPGPAPWPECPRRQGGSSGRGRSRSEHHRHIQIWDLSMYFCIIHHEYSWHKHPHLLPQQSGLRRNKRTAISTSSLEVKDLTDPHNSINSKILYDIKIIITLNIKTKFNSINDCNVRLSLCWSRRETLLNHAWNICLISFRALYLSTIASN